VECAVKIIVILSDVSGSLLGLAAAVVGGRVLCTEGKTAWAACA